jgi:hypothetical protein
VAAGLGRNVLLALALGVAASATLIAYLLIIGMPVFWFVSTLVLLKGAAVLPLGFVPRLPVALANAAATGAAYAIGGISGQVIGLTERSGLLENSGIVAATLQLAALFAVYGAVFCTVAAALAPRR